MAKALAYFTLDDSDRAYVRAARGIAAFVELLFIDDPRLQVFEGFTINYTNCVRNTPHLR